MNAMTRTGATSVWFGCETPFPRNLLSFPRENKPTAQFLPCFPTCVRKTPGTAETAVTHRYLATDDGPLTTDHLQKKKASAVAGKLSLCFVAFVWSQGPKRNVVTLSYRFEDTRTSALEPRVRHESQLPLGSLLRRLLGRLLGRLLSGLLCHGACHLLSLINLVIKKNSVNDFLISSHPFSARDRARHESRGGAEGAARRKSDRRERHE